MAVNKVIQEFSWKHFQPIKMFKVESSHRNPDTSEPIFYRVELFANGEMFCNCMAGSFRRKCRHQLQILDELSEKYGDVWKAISYYKNNK